MIFMIFLKIAQIGVGDEIGAVLPRGDQDGSRASIRMRRGRWRRNGGRA
jgi:hypothetical protein